MMAIKERIDRVMGKKEKDVIYQMRLKKSERNNWDKLANKNGFTSTAGFIKFLVNKAEREPSKIFG